MAGTLSIPSSSSSSNESPSTLDSDISPSDTSAPRSAFLRLPVDIFKCVTDYLDRDAAWALKRSCMGMASSSVVTALLYKYPIQLNDVRDMHLGDWKYKSMGRQRWISFTECINDENRRCVQKLAMSHFCSIADLVWCQDNLPGLVSLDLTAVKDFVWTPEETWTWRMLADACPKLFAQLEELEVSNWADYTTHSRIEYSYAYDDYRFRQRFRLSRRRDGGSVAAMVFPKCVQLRTLAIRERYTGFHTWNEWEVHGRVCCLVDGIVKNCSETLSKLRVHDYAPYRSIFCSGASMWENLAEVEIGLYQWMEDRRERDFIGPIPHRITQGTLHRDEEEAFDDKTFDTCDRNHMELGQHVVKDACQSFEDLLSSLRQTTRKYPNIRIRPISTLKNIVLPPFHLVNVSSRRRHVPPVGFQPQAMNQQASQQADPVSSKDIQSALRWLHETCDWRPIISWDSMMCDVFPANLESSRTFLPKADILSRIQSMIKTLRSQNIPIRISIGDRTNTCPSSRTDGSLYFGDFKALVGEKGYEKEILAPTQARFNLTLIAPLVDELTIQYPFDVPSVAGWSQASKRPAEEEKMLLAREMKGWRRFWARYASLFINLKKVTAVVPTSIYQDWSRTPFLPSLFQSEKWQMLNIDEKSTDDAGFFPAYFPQLSSLRYGLARKRTRMRFVQRVFFRQDNAEMALEGQAGLMDDVREDRQIFDEDIKTITDKPSHRFWSCDVVEVSGDSQQIPDKMNGDGKGTANMKATGQKRKVADVNAICAECSGVNFDCGCNDDATHATKRVRVAGANDD